MYSIKVFLSKLIFSIFIESKNERVGLVLYLINMNSFTVGDSSLLYGSKDLKRGSLPVTFVRTIPLTPPVSERKTVVSALSDTSRSITYVQSPKPQSEHSQNVYENMRKNANVKNILISLSANYTQMIKVFINCYFKS